MLLLSQRLSVESLLLLSQNSQMRLPLRSSVVKLNLIFLCSSARNQTNSQLLLPSKFSPDFTGPLVPLQQIKIYNNNDNNN